jgi:hypothetical protein
MGFKITKNTINKGLEKLEDYSNTIPQLAIKRGLEVMRTAIVPKTPKISGRLQGSLSGKPFKEGDSIFVVEKTMNGWRGIIGSNVIYALKVEMNSKKNRGFFTNTFNANLPKAISAIKYTLKSEWSKIKP